MPFWKNLKDKHRKSASAAPPTQGHIVPVYAQPANPVVSGQFPPSASPIPNPSVANHAAQPREPFRSHGNQLAAQNDYNGAVVMFNSALQLAPQDTELLLSRSLAHMMSTPPRLDLALKDADDAIQLNPASAQGWMQKGEVLKNMGFPQNAVDVFNNAVGCAQPHERVAAQRALAGARQQAGTNSQTHQTHQHQIIQPSPQPSSSTSISSPPPVTVSSPHPASGAYPPSSGGNMSATLFPERSPTTTTVSPTTASTNPGLSPPLEQPRAATPSALGNAPIPPAPITTNLPSNTTEDPSRRTSILPSPTANRNTDTSRNAQTVNRNSTNSQALPQSLFEDLNPPEGPPPAYTENLTDPVVLNRKLSELEQVLKIRNRGSLLIQPYTLPGQIDAVRLLYNAMTANKLTARETGPVIPVHPNLAETGTSISRATAANHGFFVGGRPPEADRLHLHGLEQEQVRCSCAVC
ncbi:hypothetical protein BDW62DRAFT_157728 [Aspergillus aurantiobrunneus]